MIYEENWQKSDAGVFWGEIAPCNHLVQIYETDDILLDTLEGFISSGFDSGDSVIIIATAIHLQSLNKRLRTKGYDIEKLVASRHFMPLDAEQSLKAFMVNGWPDDGLFFDFVKAVLTLAKGDGNRKVRAFGEMVAILWGQGFSGATVQLEHLWNKFCESEDFCLFCSYPKIGFTQDAYTSINQICSTHAKVIAGNVSHAKEVLYRHV
jgi:hypothetical protein